MSKITLSTPSDSIIARYFTLMLISTFKALRPLNLKTTPPLSANYLMNKKNELCSFRGNKSRSESIMGTNRRDAYTVCFMAQRSAHKPNHTQIDCGLSDFTPMLGKISSRMTKQSRKHWPTTVHSHITSLPPNFSMWSRLKKVWLGLFQCYYMLYSHGRFAHNWGNYVFKVFTQLLSRLMWDEHLKI